MFVRTAFRIRQLFNLNSNQPAIHRELVTLRLPSFSSSSSSPLPPVPLLQLQQQTHSIETIGSSCRQLSSSVQQDPILDEPKLRKEFSKVNMHKNYIGFRDCTVDEILQQKYHQFVYHIDENDSVFSAIRLMAARNIGALIVTKSIPFVAKSTMAQAKQQQQQQSDVRAFSEDEVDFMRSVSGIISERDYLKKVIIAGRTSLTTSVKEIMTPLKDLVAVTKEVTAAECMALMTERHLRHLPVILQQQRLQQQKELQQQQEQEQQQEQQQQQQQKNNLNSRSHFISLEEDVIGLVSMGDIVKSIILEQKETIDFLRCFIERTG